MVGRRSGCRGSAVTDVVANMVRVGLMVPTMLTMPERDRREGRSPAAPGHCTTVEDLPCAASLPSCSPFVALSGVFPVLTVYAEAGPEATPVETSTDEMPMGSVSAPVRQTGPRFSLVGVTRAEDPAVTD